MGDDDGDDDGDDEIRIGIRLWRFARNLIGNILEIPFLLELLGGNGQDFEETYLII